MKSLLTALQEGRLIELPENNKHKALEYLATLIEAIPDIGVEGGITEKVFAREQAHNTGIGKGWACPHARSTRDGELVCSVGWSPTGIDYGAPDGLPVHLLVMYFVPEAQKSAYLKEISALARAIQSQPELQDFKSMDDLNDVRHRLLDAISVALESSAPEARARMIQLEVKHAAAQTAGAGLPIDLSGLCVPLSILAMPGANPIVLCQDPEMVTLLEGQNQVATQLSQHARVEHQGVTLLLRASSHFQPDRVLYECLALKAGKPAGVPGS